MHFATRSYRSVKNILVHELDRLPPQQPAQPEDGQIQFRFAREHGYFDTDHAAQTPQEIGDTKHKPAGVPESRPGDGARRSQPTLERRYRLRRRGVRVCLRRTAPRRLVTPRGRLCNRSVDRHAPRDDRRPGASATPTAESRTPRHANVNCSPITGLVGSMSRRGKPFDNAKAESFRLHSAFWLSEPRAVQDSTRPVPLSKPRPEPCPPQGAHSSR